MLISPFHFPPKPQMELRDVDNGNKVSLRFGTEEPVESMHLNLLNSEPSLLKFKDLGLWLWYCIYLNI